MNYYTKRSLALLLGVKYVTIQDWAKKGIIVHQDYLMEQRQKCPIYGDETLKHLREHLEALVDSRKINKSTYQLLKERL